MSTEMKKWILFRFVYLAFALFISIPITAQDLSFASPETTVVNTPTFTIAQRYAGQCWKKNRHLNFLRCPFYKTKRKPITLIRNNYFFSGKYFFISKSDIIYTTSQLI